MPSTPTEDKTDVHNSSWDYHNENENENEKRNFTSTPTPQTHTWFENLAYSSHLAVESDPCQLPETLETSKAEVSAVPYQPQYYLSILNDDAPSSPGEAAGRKTSLRYISQTDVHCIGRRLWCTLFDRLSNVWVTKRKQEFLKPLQLLFLTEAFTSPDALLLLTVQSCWFRTSSKTLTLHWNDAYYSLNTNYCYNVKFASQYCMAYNKQRAPLF